MNRITTITLHKCQRVTPFVFFAVLDMQCQL